MGALVGIVLGFISEFLFPQVLKSEVIFNLLFRQQTTIPQNTQYSLGSVFSVGLLIPTLTGLLGAFVGFVLYKIKR